MVGLGQPRGSGLALVHFSTITAGTELSSLIARRLAIAEARAERKPWHGASAG